MGCGKTKRSKDLIPEKEFIQLLVDIHMFDAILTNHALNEVTGNIDSLTIYSSVLKKYNTDKETFDATMKWYSTNHEELSMLYDNVFGEINKRLRTIDEQMDLFNQTGNKNIYNSKKYKNYKGDTANYPKPYIIKTDSAGTYLFNIRLRMFEDDKSVNPRIIAYFINNKTNPTDSILAIDAPMIKSNHSRDYQYIAELTDNKYKYIKLTIPYVEEQEDHYYKNMQILNMKILKKVEKKFSAKKEPEKDRN